MEYVSEAIRSCVAAGKPVRGLAVKFAA